MEHDVIRKCEHSVYIPSGDPDGKSMYCTGCTPPFVAAIGRNTTMHFHQEQVYRDATNCHLSG